MKLPPKDVYVNSVGYCSDGTSMYNWSVARLKNCIETCWYKDISDLAKRILLKQMDEIKKLNLEI